MHGAGAKALFRLRHRFIEGHHAPGRLSVVVVAFTATVLATPVVAVVIAISAGSGRDISREHAERNGETRGDREQRAWRHHGFIVMEQESPGRAGGPGIGFRLPGA
jgi:hypothetical protein